MDLTDFLKANANISGNKALSDNQTSIKTKVLSDNTTKIASENQITTKIGTAQMGLVNLTGNLDLSTKKSALLYSPISVNNSPNSRVSSSPQIDQAGENGLSGLLSGGNTLILVAGLGLALLLLAGKPSGPTNIAPSIRTGKISAKVPAVIA